MYWCIEKGHLIGAAKKAGSTSLQMQYATLNGRSLKSIPHYLAVELAKCRWWVDGLVRDPIDRIESCYNFFQEKNAGQFPGKRKFGSIEHFLDSVLTGALDEHWQPQAYVLSACNRYFDLETYPLTKHVNRSEHTVKIPEQYLHDLRNYYAVDYEIRGKSWQ